MPIVSYLLVAGSLLFGLLFAVDAALPSREPLRLSSDFHGLAHVVPAAPVTTDIPILSRTSAPEPDMSSDLVVAAQPPEHARAQPLRTEPLTPAGVVTPSRSTAKTQIAHKSHKYRKRMVQQRQWQNDYRRAYAWQNDNRAWYRDERRFGRF